MSDMLNYCKCTESLDCVIAHLAKRANFSGKLDLVVRSRPSGLIMKLLAISLKLESDVMNFNMFIHESNSVLRCKDGLFGVHIHY